MTPVSRILLGEDYTYRTTGQRLTHTYVIGQPGTGKSRVLESWIRQDMLTGHGVAVIDPHGDLYSNLVMFLAAKPALWERVILLNPCDPTWTVSFNPLEAAEGVSPERSALFLTDVVVKVWKLNPTESPRLVWLLTNTFLALSSLGLTLLDLPRFLTDGEYREQLLPNVQLESVKLFFAHEFPRTPGAIHQWITPVLNKLGGLLFDSDVRLLLTGRPTISFREVLDKNRILLVNLPKGTIGEGASSLIGAFIVAHIQKAALSRANTRQRTPYFLYLDEFQNYTTDNIQDILSESRKYGLSLTLAHQYLAQLSPELRHAVLNTSGTIACFRVGYHDAVQLAKDIFPSSNFVPKQSVGYTIKYMNTWPFLGISKQPETIHWEGLAGVLANLPTRHFWVKYRGQSIPMNMRSLSVPDVLVTPQLKQKIQELVNETGTQYGKHKQTACREQAQQGFTNQPNGHIPHEAYSYKDEIPLWG